MNTRVGRISILRAIDTENYKNTKDTKTTKTKSPRVIDIDDEVLTALQDYKAAREAISVELVKPESFIFSKDDGYLRSPDSITSLWARRLNWLQAAHPNLGRVNLKGLRHTHATVLLELGVSPKVIQERLGHTTITTTMNVYSHVTPTMQRGAVAEFTKHLAAS